MRTVKLGTARRTRRPFAALVAGVAITACVLGLVGVMSPAGAANDPAPQLTVERVDARTDQVAASGNLVGAGADQLTAVLGGRTVDSNVVGAGDIPLDAIVVLDNSAALGNATVQLAKQALAPLLPGRGVTRSLGLVTTGGGATVEVPGTTNADAFEAALSEVQPVGASSTWEGIIRAADMLGDRGFAQRAVILFSASTPVAGGRSAGSAQTALSQADAQLRAVAMPRGADIEGIENIVAGVGGSVSVVDDENALSGAFESMSKVLAGRFLLTFQAPSGVEGLTKLTVKAGSLSTTVAYMPGATRTGSANLAPPVPDGPGVISRVLGNPFGLIAVVLLGFAAIVLFFWTLISMVLPNSDSLNRRLKVYEDPYGEETEEDVDTGHTTVPIIQRAVELTGDVAERRGVLQRLEGDLERASLPLRAAEALFFVLVASVLVTIATFALTKNVMVTLIFAALTIAVPRLVLRIQVRRRCKAFERQLPDTLTLLAGTLRAGYSIGQGFEAVSTEIDDPMGRELRRVVTETRLGRPLNESLEAVADRMQSDDFAWAVMAIRIQREVGGNLAELLVTVAETMTQRERLRRDVNTLTAEGRMSAIVLGLLPPGLGVIMWAINPDYMSKLFEPGLGYILLGLALVSMLIGFAWMKKIITIEV